MRPSIKRALAEHVVLEALAASALAVAIVVWMTGSVQVSLFGLPVRARGLGRPLAVGVVLVALRMGLVFASRPSGGRVLAAAASLFRVTSFAVLAADLGIVLTSLVTSCGGLDSAGYLATAKLFLSGHLTVLQPVAHLLPAGVPAVASAPLGFVPAAEALHIAPRFPPGLPLVMAALAAAAGESASFYAAPLLGFATLPLIYGISRRTTDADVALLATVLAGTNPVFLGMALQPMSDVPSTFWIVLAAWFLWRPEPSSVAGAVAAGMAILTRPPLALAAIALGVTAGWRDRRGPLSFAGVTGAFVLALILFQRHVYGHPFTSGYGTAGQLFTLASLAWNATHYAKWLLAVFTPLAIAAFVAGAFVAPRLAWRASILFGATAAPYLVYAPRFEDWEILRFLLPGMPLASIVCAGGVAIAVGGRTHRLRMLVAGTVVAVAAAAGSYGFLLRQHLTGLWQQELRYPLVGRWFAANTPPNSVALAALHSGSVRYYSGRPAIRQDLLPDTAFAATVAALEQAGYQPYVVVEQGEELERAERQFAAGALAVSPEARIRGVYVFRVAAAR